jgi:quinol monooxygenase YgiN
MKPLYLIAEIFPHPEKLSEARVAFAELIAATKKEPGCMLYDLVTGDNTDTWLMIEKWESRQAWDSHMLEPHVAHITAIEAEITRMPTKLNFYDPLEIPVQQS